MFFFSSSTAPSIFKILPRQTAGNLITDIFPKYYLIAYVSGGVGIIASIFSWFTKSSSSWASYVLIRVIILAIMLGLTVFAGTVIRPQALEVRTEMRSLSEDSPHYRETEIRFNKLHRQFVTINSIVFLLGIAIIFITAYNIKE
jgi:hypothetical protein